MSRLFLGDEFDDAVFQRLCKAVARLGGTIKGRESLGTTFRSKPISGPGGKQVLVEDPSGNPIELFQPRSGDGEA